MTSPGVGVKVEKLNSAALIVSVPDLVSTAHVKVALDDDREEAPEHAGGLEHVRPHDGLNAPDSRVENADGENHEACYVQVEAGYLLKNIR